MATRVVVTDQVFGSLEIERGLLAPLDAELVEAPAKDEATLVGAVAGADALLVCYASVTPAVIEAAAAGGCRVIARYGIGVDNIDLEAATAAGIVVTNVPDYCLDEVADHGMALLLGVARGLVEGALAVREGRWELPGAGIHRIRGRTLALVGVGRIGRRLADRALAFGLDVVAFDPFASDLGTPGIRRAATLEEAVAEADFVSLHAPMTEENHHMVGDRLIGAMRRGPVIVNTARGGLVDLDAVLAALDDGRLSAVALDVTEVEPLPEAHPLRRHPRAVITPHMAFHSEEAQQELQRRAAEEVVRALAGEPPRCPVNAVDRQRA